MRRMVSFGILGLGLSGPALAQSPSPAADQPPAAMASPADARVYIINPRQNARVTSPVTVQFGLRNMGVTQAGSAAKNAGHHHVLVDVAEPITAGEPIPADKNHLHFGGGQTETRIELPPGRHTLQLVLGDAQHRLFNPSVQSDKVTIMVVSRQPKPNRRGARRRVRSY